MPFYPSQKKPLDLNQVKKKIMDLLARRDHTVKELKKKLKDRTDSETLQLALTWAEQQNWIPTDEKITEQLVRSLRLKKKGTLVINNKLKEVGLQPVTPTEEDELNTALTALASKFASDFLSQKEYKDFQKSKAKVMRFLVSRGFTPSIAQKASKVYFSKETNVTRLKETSETRLKENSDVGSVEKNTHFQKNIAATSKEEIVNYSDEDSDSFFDLNYSNEDEESYE